eukprot:722909-Prymnesium_polylepis.1
MAPPPRAAASDASAPPCASLARYQPGSTSAPVESRRDLAKPAAPSSSSAPRCLGDESRADDEVDLGEDAARVDAACERASCSSSVSGSTGTPS